MGTKTKYVIDWKVEGTFEVEAASAKEAETAFEKAWNSPTGIMPIRDGEVYTSEPVPFKD